MKYLSNYTVNGVQAFNRLERRIKKKSRMNTVSSRYSSFLELKTATTFILTFINEVSPKLLSYSCAKAIMNYIFGGLFSYDLCSSDFI